MLADPRSQGAVQLITSVPTCDQGSVLWTLGEFEILPSS